MTPEWYAVRVKSNHAKIAVESLQSTGHTVFHATYRDKRQWSDRQKDVEVPLFAGYLFCHLNINQRLPVLQAPGVIDFVRFGSNFIPIPEEEVAAVRTIVNSAAFSRPCPYLNVGERVVVHQGPLAGIEGILLERRGDTSLIVSVNLLQRSIVTPMDVSWVKPIRQSFMRNSPLEVSTRIAR